MNVKLLFSIPVHEKPDVIVDQLNNFLLFNPNSNIILHLSRQMIDADVENLRSLIQNFSSVYINTVRFYSGWGDGSLIKIHLSNFEYALNAKIEFTHCCLHASNDMFVRKGLDFWVDGFDAGFDRINKGKNNPVYQQIDHFSRDFSSVILAKKYKITKVLGSQIEGSFYSRELIVKLLERVNSRNLWDLPFIFSMGIHSLNSFRYKIYLWTERILRLMSFPIKITIFCREEVYFPTLVFEFIKKSRPFNYCYINWSNGLKLTNEEIIECAKGNNQILIQKKKFDTNVRRLEEVQFFAVKRVERDINDPQRKFISQLLTIK